MFSSLRRLTDFELRTVGEPARRALAACDPDVVCFELQVLPDLAAAATLAVLDAWAALYPTARVELKGAAPLAQLLCEARGWSAATDRGRRMTVRFDVTARVGLHTTANGWVCVVAPVGAELEAGDAAAPADWRRGALASGVDAGAQEAVVRFAPARLTAGMRWLRARVGIFSGPVTAVALTPGSPHAEVLERARHEWSARLGTQTLALNDGPVEPAVLPGCAWCVGDDSRWLALAAALGRPTLRLSSQTSERGVTIVYWGPSRRELEGITKRFGFASDCNLQNLVQLGELLAALSWPGDRVRRMSGWL
jgi:hypothetical protein